MRFFTPLRSVQNDKLYITLAATWYYAKYLATLDTYQMTTEISKYDLNIFLEPLWGEDSGGPDGD